jgi:hypothetical protein
VTLRCLRDDLGLGLPTVDVDLGGLDHPLLAEARRVAQTAPRAQKRILAIAHPLVYRLRHGRWRGATWLESAAARFWLLAGAQREAGARDDAYEMFVASHEAGQLLPDDDDRLRDALERNARVLAAARAEVPRALEDASARRGQDVVHHWTYAELAARVNKRRIGIYMLAQEVDEFALARIGVDFGVQGCVVVVDDHPLVATSDEHRQWPGVDDALSGDPARVKQLLVGGHLKLIDLRVGQNVIHNIPPLKLSRHGLPQEPRQLQFLVLGSLAKLIR